MNFNHVTDKTSQKRLPLAINYIKRMKTANYKKCTDVSRYFLMKKKKVQNLIYLWRGRLFLLLAGKGLLSFFVLPFSLPHFYYLGHWHKEEYALLHHTAYF